VTNALVNSNKANSACVNRRANKGLAAEKIRIFIMGWYEYFLYSNQLPLYQKSARGNILFGGNIYRQGKRYKTETSLIKNYANIRNG
jgi:hypothetical protein